METYPAVVRSCTRKEGPPTTQSTHLPAGTIPILWTHQGARVLFGVIIFASPERINLHAYYMVLSLCVRHLRIHSLHERHNSADERRIIFGGHFFIPTPAPTFVLLVEQASLADTRAVRPLRTLPALCTGFPRESQHQPDKSKGRTYPHSLTCWSALQRKNGLTMNHPRHRKRVVSKASGTRPTGHPA